MNLPALIDPMTPHDCDCRGLPFMPLEVSRLRDSDFSMLSTGDEFKAAIMLWCAAWLQVPAASVPDDDRILARLAGLSPAEWREVRDAALRGFIKCSDGRLYHSLIADHAVAAFDKRKGQAARANSRWSKARTPKPGECHGNAVALPEDMPTALPPVVPPAMPPAIPLAVPLALPLAVPSAMQVKGTVKGDKKDSLSPGGDAEPKPRQAYPEAFELAWRTYPHFRGRSSKPDAVAAWRKLPADERDCLAAAIGRFRPNVESVCGGKGAPDMAVWLKQAKHLNWLDDGDGSPPPEATPWTGPPDIRAAVVAERDEGFAVSWLDRCAWGPLRSIVAPNKLVAERLNKGTGDVLRALGVRITIAETDQ
jgi:uncharacterized protein YdaU (DUF1376 family)